MIRTLSAMAIILAAPACANDLSLRLNDSQQQDIVSLPALMDQCVAGVMMHGDANMCRNISGFLTSLAASVRQAADKAVAEDQQKPKDD